MPVEKQQDPSGGLQEQARPPAAAPDSSLRRAESALDQAESLLGEALEPGDALGDASWRLTVARWSLGRREISQRQRFRHAAMLTATVATTVYLIYRLFWTLNLATPAATVFSAVLWAAELYAGISLALYFFQVWRLVEPPLRRPTPGRTVDVFVTTYNEDVSLLRGTLMACVAMDYPHKTYVLDDGSREEVRRLAESLGVHYISRADHSHAKAGNINNALRQTKGEFVVILDADHVPYQHFLTRLIGYFDDPGTGFVQAPHTTYNLDNFLGRWKSAAKAYWEDVRIFFEAVQLGKNRFGVACFCGSAAIFRRKALEDVGLIATETITEDLHTGMRINAAGWKSMAVGEELVVGLAPDDAATFSSQRLRWGEGNLSVLAYDNPLTMKGLSLAGRINYLASIGCWTMGPWRLVLYLTPLVMLLTGVAPVADMSVSYFAIVACYLTAVWSAVKIASNGCGQLLGIELAMMASFHLQLQALWRALFRRRRQTFVVTAKNRLAKPSGLRRMWPQAALVVASIVAISWAASRCLFGISSDYLGLAIGGGLAVYHSLLAMTILARTTAKRTEEQSWRHPLCLAAEYTVANATEPAVSTELNENGCRLLTWKPLTPGSALDIALYSPVGGATCHGRVAASEPIGGRRPFAHLSNIAFGDTDPQQQERQSDMLRGLILRYIVPLVTMAHRLARLGSQVMPEQLSGEGDFPVPIVIEADLPNVAAQRSVALSMDRRGFLAALETPYPVGQVARITMSTPLGPIVSGAEIEDVETMRVGASIIYQHKFRWRDRSSIRRFVSRKGGWRSALTRAVNRMRNHRQPPMRVAVLQLAACLVAAITVLVAGGVYRGDRVLVAAARRPVTPADRGKVEAELERAAALPGDSVDGLLRTYKAADAIGDHARAAEAARRLADRVAKGRVEWMLTGARQLVQAGDHRAADAAFDKMLSEHGEREFSLEKQAEVYVEAARAAIAVDNLDKAVDHFLKASDLTSTNVEQAEELLGVLIAAKKTELAIQVLRQLDRSDRVLERIVDVYEMAKQPEAAMPELKELLRRYPGNIRVIRRLAEIEVELRDFAAGAEYYATLHKLEPHDRNATAKLAETLILLARQQYAAGNRDEALALFGESFQVQPPDLKIKREYAGLLANSRRFREAVDLLEPLTDVDSRLQLAAVLEMEGDRSRALGILLDLEKSQAIGDKAERSIARLLLANREYAEATERLIRLWNKDRNDPEIQRALIDAVAASGEGGDTVRQAVLDLYRQNQESNFDNLDAEQFVRLGDALRRLELFDEARVVLDQAVARFPDSRRLRFYLAQTLGNLGRYDDAEKQYQILLDARPARLP